MGAGQVLAAIAAIFAVLALWPLIFFVHPGMADYPNHLARAFILLNPDDPILASNYRIAWELVPNLGFDLWMLAVGRVTNLDDAGRLFIAFTAIATVVGTFALALAIHGRVTIMQMFGFPLIFTTGFAFGFLSFNLGMAAMLFAAAYWEWIGEDWPKLRLLGGTVFATTLYMLHFAGFGAYGLYVLGSRLWVLKACYVQGRLRQWFLAFLCDGLQALPAVGIFFLGRIGLPESFAGALSIDGFEIPPIRIGQIERLQDLGAIWINAIPLTLLISYLVVALLAGRARISPKVAPAILIGVSIFFCLPDDINGTHYASWRVLLTAALFLVAGLQPTEKFGVRFAIGMLLSLAIELAVASSATAISWSDTERARENMLAVLHEIPEGSRIFYTQTDKQTRQEKRANIGVYHLGSYAVIERRALVQSMFVAPGQQPLRFRDPVVQAGLSNSSNRFLDIRRAFALAGVSLQTHLEHFDYILCQGKADARLLEPLPLQSMQFVRRVGDAWLFRLIQAKYQNEEEKSSPR